MRRRAAILVLDGVGAGDAPDAARFGDEGANTLSNTARAVAGLELSHLRALGLGNVAEIEGTPPLASPKASYGLMQERSAAKATLAGHWEMMGIILKEALLTYPDGFPEEIVVRFARETGREVIGNRPASGTEIIDKLGPEQESSGAWIVYTSADSVFQVAAHTGVIQLEELYEACEKAREMLIGEGQILVERVIARPYHGKKGSYERENENRHDYGITPPEETYLDGIKNAAHDCIAVGKIRDIFDARGPELLQALKEDDLLVITADHGNDPTFKGTDHTRERVPLLVVKGGASGGDLGVRRGFADLGATAAGWLGVEKGDLPGEDFLHPKPSSARR